MGYSGCTRRRLIGNTDSVNTLEASRRGKPHPAARAPPTPPNRQSRPISPPFAEYVVVVLRPTALERELNAEATPEAQSRRALAAEEGGGACCGMERTSRAFARSSCVWLDGALKRLPSVRGSRARCTYSVSKGRSSSTSRDSRFDRLKMERPMEF